jgi:hypothetical protein
LIGAFHRHNLASLLGKILIPKLGAQR